MHITTAAIDSYRYHHGGPIESAASELRTMLAAFAEQSRVGPSGGFVTLKRDGYKLILNETQEVLTGYSTVHRERTWAQFQAAVPSRFPGRGSGGGRLLKEPAEYRPLHCNPATVRIRRAALKNFATRMELQHLAEVDLEGELRRFISGLGPAKLGAVRTDESLEFTEGEVRVILSADQTRIRDVLWPRRSGGDADAPHAHGDSESGQPG